jgi:hypothetical protein
MVCCATVNVQSGALNRDSHGVFVDTTAKTWKDSFSRGFTQMEITEKGLEIIDESFHLLSDLIKAYSTLEFYEFSKSIHDAAHTLEHVMHNFCFFGNLHSIVFAKDFISRDEKKEIRWMVTAGKVCLVVSHALCTLTMLKDTNLVDFGQFTPILKYRNLFSFVAYTLPTISLIQNYKKNSKKDITMYLSGSLFTGLPLINSVKCLESCLGGVSPLLSKATAVAGIVHAILVRKALSSSKVSLTNYDAFVRSSNKTNGSCHDHSH